MYQDREVRPGEARWAPPAPNRIGVAIDSLNGSSTSPLRLIENQDSSIIEALQRILTKLASVNDTMFGGTPEASGGVLKERPQGPGWFEARIAQKAVTIDYVNAIENQVDRLVGNVQP